jgi:hypothetical protein
VAEPLAALLAAALAAAPVPSASPAASRDTAARTRPVIEVEVDTPSEDKAAEPVAPLSDSDSDSDSDSEAVAPVDNTEPALPPFPVMEGPEPAPTPAAAGGLCHGSRPCKRLVVLASVTGGLGLASMIAGGVLLARPQRVDPADPTLAIAYRPAGSAALAIGIGVLATSLLMTLAAVRAIRHAKKSALPARPHPLALRPSAG